MTFSWQSYIISSYSDVANNVLIKLLFSVIRDDISENQFNLILDITKQALIKDRFEQPYIKANNFFYENVKNNYFLSEGLLEVIKH